MKRWLFKLLFGAESKRLEQLERERHECNQKVSVLYTEFENKLAARDRLKRARFDRYVAMTEAAMADALAGTAQLPSMKAVMQLIDEKFQQAGDAAADPALADGQTKFHLGGADWIVRLKAELQGYCEKPKEG